MNIQITGLILSLIVITPTVELYSCVKFWKFFFLSLNFLNQLFYIEYIFYILTLSLFIAKSTLNTICDECIFQVTPGFNFYEILSFSCASYDVCLIKDFLSFPPGSSVHGIFQARILEWVALPISRGSSRPRDQTCASYISCTGRRVLYHQRQLGSP